MRKVIEYKGQEPIELSKKLLEEETSCMKGKRTGRTILQLLNFRTLKSDNIVSNDDYIRILRNLPDEYRDHVPIYQTHASFTTLWQDKDETTPKVVHVRRDPPWLPIRAGNIIKKLEREVNSELTIRHQVYNGLSEMHFIDWMFHYKHEETYDLFQAGTYCFSPEERRDGLKELNKLL